MTAATESDESPTLSPEEALAVLGEETRLQVLQTLGDADGPLAFSELFDRIDYDDSLNFGYHLEKLTGHFVHKSEGGYDLHQAGRRVVEAVVSGVVTDAPVVERTDVDASCTLCDGAMEVQYRNERLELYCPDCGGVRNNTSATTAWATETADDIVGYLDLPPAGLSNRTPTEALAAAEIWTVAETQALARGVCPRCSARVEDSLQVCGTHHPSDGHCDECGQQFRATMRVTCTNCPLDQQSVFTKRLLATPAVMAFLVEHGIDPLAPAGVHLSNVDETIRSTDPFEAIFTVTLGDDALTLTVDDSLSVSNVTSHGSTDGPGNGMG